MGHRSPRILILRQWRQDTRRTFEDEALGRPNSDIDYAACQKCATPRNQDPAQSVQPCALLQVFEKPRDVGAVLGKQIYVLPAVAREGLARLLVAEAGRCGCPGDPGERRIGRDQ